jgi:hypothetical protein
MTMDRRRFLSLASLPLLARLPVPALRRRPAALIQVWLDGGLSHLDAFDGKPEAPGDVRGDGRWIRGQGPAGGEAWLSDHLPKVAARLGRCALLRSLTHGEGNHDRASQFMLTGHRPSPVLVHPAHGAVLSLDAPEDDPLPAYVAIPSPPDAGGRGFLPPAHGPFVVGAGRAAVPAPHAEDGPRERLVDLLDALDGAPRSPDEAARDHFARKARAMRGDRGVRELFDLDRAAPAFRERFGRHELGQACCLAARLALGGVRTVLVRNQGWDHHRDVRTALTQGFPGKLPQLDDATAALLDVVQERDAQGRILVVVASEFGRNPRLNPDAGRDHWPRAQSVLLAGAGIREGVVHGATDARGEEPANEPCSPADLWATVLAARGADLQAVLTTPDGRPVRVVPEDAAPIAALLRDRA